MDELARILADRATLNQYLHVFRTQGQEAAETWLVAYEGGGVSAQTLSELADWYLGSLRAGQSMQADPGEYPDINAVPRDPTLPRSYRYQITVSYTPGEGRPPVYRTVYLDSNAIYTEEAAVEAAQEMIEAEYGELIPSPDNLNLDIPYALGGTVNAIWRQ